MKTLVKTFSLALVALLLWWVWRYALMGVDIATGYAAKQTCSGVFVAGLPQSFVVAQDVEPRLSVLGPALSLLDIEVDDTAGEVRGTLLGATAVARYAPAQGCTLHPDFPQSALRKGDAARAIASAHRNPEPFSALLDAAFEEPEAGGRNTLAIAILHRGELVAQRYRAPVDESTPMQGWSMNKSLMATWVGMQVAAGALSLEQTVAQGVRDGAPQVEGLADGISPDLNLGHLLHMESGLDFEETYAPGDDATRMLYRAKAAWRVAPELGQAHAPGTHFSYSSGDTNTAAFLWQQSLGDEAYWAWLSREFYGPLGIQSAVSEADGSGVQVGSSYTYMTARDWGRVGMLWLDAWHGRSSMVSAEWQRAAVRPRPANSAGDYGRGFWLNTAGVAFPDLPHTLFFASGNAGQSVLVLPEQELVVVRLGLSQPGAELGLSVLLQAILAVLDES